MNAMMKELASIPNAYSGSFFIIEISSDFDFTKFRNNFKRITNVTSSDGVRQSVLCTANKSKLITLVG